MTVGVWRPGRSYPTGSLARPTGGGAVVPSQVVNGTFESGDVDWTKGTGWTINSGDQPFQGSWSAKFSFTGTTNLDSQNDVPVTPGQSITCSAMVQQGASSAGQAGARVILVWLDGSGAEVSTSQGNLVDSASGGAWKMSTVTATAPAGAETVFARVTAFRTGGSNPLWVDNVLWNYTVPNPGTGLIYQAVQPDTGTSASSEPAWPTVLGVQVNDGSVVWEAIGDTRIEWTARPILESGATEPTWPTIPGEFVSDGNIAWECVVRNVTDERCPNTKVVLIAASKIFAVDEDIVAFSATVNPLDWSTEGDAGYLPTGLQQYGANPMAALGLYRGNLVAWNSQGMQIWQVDEDPARMQLLDALPIGSTYPKAVSPVQNDLFFLTQLGVRSLGIAGGSVNLQAGDVGMPIDPLVREAIADAAAVSETGLSAYYPAQGQYFLAFTTVPGEGIDISNPLSEAFLGVAVDHQYIVTGGIGPYEFVIDRGSLPTGLVMDSLGNITGTPTEVGEFAWRVRVYDSTLRSDALDEGIDLAEGIDGGEEFEVMYPPGTLVSDQDYYSGAASALTSSGTMGWDNAIDRVRVSPDGVYAAGSIDNNTNPARFEIRKFDPDSGTWSALASPASMPTAGPLAMAWSADGVYLAIATRTLGQYIWVYKRSGDTFTKLADPAELLPNGPNSWALAWSADGSALAVGNASSADSVYVWDFVADELVNRRNLSGSGTNFIGGAPYRLDFFGDLLACQNGKYVFVVDTAQDPMPVLSAAPYDASPNVTSGCFWNAAGDHIIAIENDYVYTIEWDGGTDTLTLLASDQILSAGAADSSIDPSKRYIAVANNGTIEVVDLGVSSIPVPVVVDDLLATGVASVSFSGDSP